MVSGVEYSPIKCREDPKINHVMPTSRERVFYQVDYPPGIFLMEVIMFERTIKLIGEDNLNKLKKANVLIVGLGGVGGICAEALVRSGIGKITIIDYDTIEESNLNRQIITNIKTVGQKKVKVALERLQNINPKLEIKALDIFLNEENINNLAQYDFIIDACDTVTTKVLLIRYALNNNLKIISCMGTGKRLDLTKLEISTLNKTYNDPLAKIVRKKVKELGLPLNIPVVFSKELPLNNDKDIASMIFVPATAGLLLAKFVIKKIIE